MLGQSPAGSSGSEEEGERRAAIRDIGHSIENPDRRHASPRGEGEGSSRPRQRREGEQEEEEEEEQEERESFSWRVMCH